MQFSPFMNIEPPATLAMNTLAQAKRAKGEQVFNLTVGEPLLETPGPIKAAAIDALNTGKTHYPPVAGIMELRQASVDWMNRTFGTHFSVAQSLVTCGGKFALFAACQALINPGNEALIIAPYWVSYSEMVKLFGGKPVIVQSRKSIKSVKSDDDWKVSIVDLEKNVSAKTKILFLNNGGNPTGTIYTHDEIANILAFAAKHDLVVFSDEVYGGLTYDGEFVSCGAFPEYADRVLVIQSCSKHFAMTGWRVGHAFGPKELIEKMTLVQGQSTTGTSSVSQYAAVAGYVNAETIIPALRSAMQARRDLFVKTFSALFRSIATPPAGLYAFVSLADLGATTNDSMQFCLDALEKGGVATVPGVAFGQEGYVRFSFGGADEEIVAGLKALKEYINGK